MIRYGITSFYGNLSVQSKSQLLHITSTSSKLVGCTLSPSLQAIFEQTLVWQAQKICSDATYVLHPEYQLLPSGKHYRIPKCKLNRYNCVQVLFHSTLDHRIKPAHVELVFYPVSTQLVWLPVTDLSCCVTCTTTMTPKPKQAPTSCPQTWWGSRVVVIDVVSWL